MPASPTTRSVESGNWIREANTRFTPAGLRKGSRPSSTR